MNDIKRVLKNIFILILVVTSCKDSGSYHPIQTSKNQSAHKILALEFENAGMYTYIKVSENDSEFWIAVPEKIIEIGETYYYKGGMKMVDFKSKELNKTFDEVWFVDALYDKNPSDYVSSHPKNNIPKDPIKIIEQPENGTSIEKLLSDPETFKNEEVIIKGKVVKINKNILERNWVHIKDGTTFKDKSQITITTIDTVKLGEVLTFKGVVTLEKDFGYGYVYPVLIENGKQIN